VGEGYGAFPCGGIFGSYCCLGVPVKKKQRVATAARVTE